MPAELQTNRGDSPIRVCVIDDDTRIQAKLKAAIESRNELEFVGAAFGMAEGLELLKTCEPHVALVDLGLGDGSGLEIIRHIHQNMPDCESLVLTVFGDESHVLASVEAGATGYLTKDTQIEDIVERLKLLRGGGSPISPVIARQLLRRFRKSDNTPKIAETDQTLSERETEVLEMVSKGFMQAEIADLMGVSVNTVSTYVKRIYKKLAVNSRLSAIHRARELGIINYDKG